MVICRPVVEEIQSAGCSALPRLRTGRCDVDVFVDCFGHELRYLTLVDEMGLRVISRNVEPPSAIDVDERVRDREGGEVLYPNGMQRQECDEQSIAHANGAGQRRLAEHLRFFDQHETGFDQTLGENQPVSL